MIQDFLFESENNDTSDEKYTKKIKAPIYEIKGDKPHILSLVDTTKYKRLKRDILNSKLSEQEKSFLLLAAERHNVFNYSLIAEYYAHASKEMQELMKDSALVIIDFKKAIKNGFVKLSDELTNQYLIETQKKESKDE